MAGINAARRVQEKDPVVLRRNEAYIGVLIDDLVTREPWSLIGCSPRAPNTACSCARDNADLRLSQHSSYDVGLLPARNFQKFAPSARLSKPNWRASKRRATAPTPSLNSCAGPRCPNGQLPNRNPALPHDVVQQVEISLKYEGYIARQELEVAKLKTLDDKQIPTWLDYSKVPSPPHRSAPEARQDSARHHRPGLPNLGSLTLRYRNLDGLDEERPSGTRGSRNRAVVQVRHFG